MKIVVATDSFKGTMRSDEAGDLIADALRSTLTGAEIVVIPMADGGEGTTEAVIRATGGELHAVEATGPLGEPVEACFGIMPDGRTAVLEMAAASGLELVPSGDLDPLRATSFGTGELMRAAIDRGVREIILGIGGSATVDGGLGMAQALGYRPLTATGAECARGGAALSTVTAIDATAVPDAVHSCRIRVACDVTTPLLGEHGAARVFGPQKGASPAVVEQLEAGLGCLAGVWIEAGMLLSVDQPGDGAAGGLGAGLRAFCGAELSSGADLVAEISGFDREIAGAHLLITGEGRSDRQTLDGKLCQVLATRAADAGARTILISGAVADHSALQGVFDVICAAVHDTGGLDQALRDARVNLSAAASSVGRLLAIARSDPGPFGTR
jgi:glycerate kinase